MLQSRLLPEEHHRIQGVLLEQDNALRDAHDELRDCKTRLHRGDRFRSHPDTPSLQEELSRKNEQLADLTDKHADAQHTIGDLQAQKVGHDNRMEDLIQLMDYGTKVLCEKNQEVEDLRDEVHMLHDAITQNDETISTCTATLLRMTMAAPEEWMRMATEFQANRNLVHVQGLTGDIAERDAELAKTQDRIRTLTTANARLMMEALQTTKKIKNLETEVAATRKSSTECDSIMNE